MSHDVFICHSSKDRTLANAICAKLEANRIRCWIAPRDVVPGLEYAQSIVEAIGATRLTVLVFSQNANQSPHVHRELERTASHGADGFMTFACGYRPPAAKAPARKRSSAWAA